MERKTEENPLAKIISSDVLKSSWNKDIYKLKVSLTMQMAKQIKTWRVGEGPQDVNTHSWRSVAKEFVEKYKEFSDKNNIILSNQISGMMLCEAAMNKLKEKIEQGWN